MIFSPLILLVKRTYLIPFFAKQCALIDTPSTFPPFNYATRRRLNIIDFVPGKLSSIIKSLNPNKAHGWDFFEKANFARPVHKKRGQNPC